MVGFLVGPMVGVAFVGEALTGDGVCEGHEGLTLEISVDANSPPSATIVLS